MSRDTTSRDTSVDRADRSGEPPDDDIAALFAAQAERAVVPPELDASLRAAAREAVPVDVRRDPEPPSRLSADAGGPFPVAARHRAPPRWLAAAAVVALALVLVPLTRQAPSPDEPAPTDRPIPRPGIDAANDADDASAAPLAEVEPVLREKAALARRSIVLEEPAEPADAERTAPEALTDPGRPLESAPATPADPFDGYRTTPSAWLDRLRERLRADGPTPELLAEYRRFRARHPDVEPAFDPVSAADTGRR